MPRLDFLIQRSIVLAALACAGCNFLSGPTVCTTEARPAIHVEIRDAITNTSVAGDGRVIATDGAFADTVVTMTGLVVVGLAHERPGQYTVTVEQAGYQVWTRSGIQVRDGTCHVQTVSVVALLQR